MPSGANISRSKNDRERSTRDRLDHLTEHVGADAVLETSARLVHEKRRVVVFGLGAHQLANLVVEEPIAVAGRVRQQLAAP